MPTFRWRALDPGGELVEGEMEAPDTGQVAAHLRRRGCQLLGSEAVGGHLLPPGLKGLSPSSLFRSRRPDSRQWLATYRALSVLLQAGHPLDRALEAVIRMSGGGAAGRIATDLLLRVRAGASLSQAMDAMAGIFPDSTVTMVRTGERAGAVPIIVNRLAEAALRRASRPLAPVVMHAFMLDIPWSGALEAQALNADLLRRLGVLTAYGVALPRALDLAGECSPNRAIAASVAAAAREVRGGATLDAALKTMAWLPRTEAWRLVEADSHGMLAQACLRAADRLHDAHRQAMRRFLLWLAALTCAGGTVGMVVAP